MIRIVIAAIAARLLSKQWNDLQKKLFFQYTRLLNEQEYVPSVLLQRLLISGEDHRFFKHPGFDVIAICRAVWRCVFWGVREGASTIEQQLVRVLTGHYELTVGRKCKEILLATLVTRVVPKSDVPALYLQIAYFGWRMNGFRQACIRLNLRPEVISIQDAALMIARLKYPEPRIAPPQRLVQIFRRHDHLIRLHQRHLGEGRFVALQPRFCHAPI